MDSVLSRLFLGLCFNNHLCIRWQEKAGSISKDLQCSWKCLSVTRIISNVKAKVRNTLRPVVSTAVKNWALLFHSPCMQWRVKNGVFVDQKRKSFAFHSRTGKETQKSCKSFFYLGDDRKQTCMTFKQSHTHSLFPFYKYIHVTVHASKTLLERNKYKDLWYKELRQSLCPWEALKNWHLEYCPRSAT